MSTVFVTLLFLELFAITTIFNISFCHGNTSAGCINIERQALLRFKQDLSDPSNRLASWTGGDDCCKWPGVVCDNFTGHILELRLRNPSSTPRGYIGSFSEYEVHERSRLRGKINHSLLDLQQLVYLDLSGNSFQRIPRFLGSMANLRYLNICDSEFEGTIPHQLGNLSNLHYLELGQNFMLFVEKLSWLSSLSLLEHLDLSEMDLSGVSDWLLVTNAISSLKVLRLSNCLLHLPTPLSIAKFSSLVTLDLSKNQFDNSLIIPGWFCGLHHLVILDLSYNNFQGPIPSSLQNLTSLRFIDFSNNHFNSSIPNWLGKFSRLEYLYLGENSLEGRISSALGNISSLKSLELSSNRLEGRIPQSLGRLCNLRSIFLSSLQLSQEISEVIDIFSTCVSDALELLYLDDNQLFGHLTDPSGQFKNLDTLHLSYNSISGHIPSFLGELKSLRTLDLSDNEFEGPIPSSIGKLSTLDYLYLSFNNLSGPIPSSSGELSSLRTLDLSGNKLNGTLSEIHFTKLTRLVGFYANGNSLKFKVSPDWVPPFQIEGLNLRSCHLGPPFPSWLLSQKHLTSLDISNTGISDSIPNSFWKSSLQVVNLSHNQIHGEIPNLIDLVQLSSLDLNSNNLSGPLPLFPSNLYALDLSNNTLSGSIFSFLCHMKNESKIMQVLKLGSNFLSGEFPDCWMNMPYLLYLNLGNNKFVGNIPTSIGTLSSLQSLHLRNNKLSGTLPVSLKNCTELVALDVGVNELVGNIPSWIGKRFSSMMFLNLRSNKFRGSLPTELCNLAFLHILDLSDNNLSRAIPRCINKLSAMVTMRYSTTNNIQYPANYSVAIEDASIVIKGKVVEYSMILSLVRSIDLSKNNFSGEIPIEVTNLGALQSLNLSHNFFTGKIPESIGDMRLIESVDISANCLYGEIPQSIARLSFLSHLNLSNNQLTGKIPSSTQLQSFDASSFTGNGLRGSPLLKNCTQIVPTPEHESGERKDAEDEDEVNWFYVSMALGFVVGFWSVIGSLLLNRRWRYVYCHFLDGFGDKFITIIEKCW